MLNVRDMYLIHLCALIHGVEPLALDSLAFATTAMKTVLGVFRA